MLRRHFNWLGLSLVTLGWRASAHAQSKPASRPNETAPGNKPASPTVLVVGDSLSAEYGIRRGQGWVALLAARLQALRGNNAQVINASISGDTSAGGRSRLPGLLAQAHPTLVVIELGANDALRGLDLDSTQSNLAAMVEACRAAHAKVVLIGMQVPPNYGPDYNARLSAMYARLAQKYQTGWVPFLLKGIADAPDADRLFQADRIHPKEEAHPRMLDNVWPQISQRL